MKTPKLLKQITVAAVSVAAALAVPNWAAAADVELVVVSWGGAYLASQQQAYHDPYMRNNPRIKIINDESSSEAVAKLRAMNEVNNVTWDLVDVVAADAIRLCDEGLAMAVDHDSWLAKTPDGTSATKDFGENIKSDCFVPQTVYSTTFAYRTDVPEWNGRVPTKLADVFDLEKFPGKRSLEKRPINNLEWALIVDGVPGEEVYNVLETPEGLDRAFRKLDTIKDHVIWWTAGADTPQRLADGEVVMGTSYNGRLFNVIAEEKQPVDMMWDWQVYDVGGWIVPKGTRNLEEVKKYLHFATDTQRLADQAKYIAYSPTRKSSEPLVGRHAELGIEMKPHMPTDPANKGNHLNFRHEWWADHRDDLDERFQAWLAR